MTWRALNPKPPFQDVRELLAEAKTYVSASVLLRLLALKKRIDERYSRISAQIMALRQPLESPATLSAMTFTTVDNVEQVRAHAGI